MHRTKITERLKSDLLRTPIHGTALPNNGFAGEQNTDQGTFWFPEMGKRSTLDGNLERSRKLQPSYKAKVFSSVIKLHCIAHVDFSRLLWTTNSSHTGTSLSTTPTWKVRHLHRSNHCHAGAVDGALLISNRRVSRYSTFSKLSTKTGLNVD